MSQASVDWWLAESKRYPEGSKHHGLCLEMATNYMDEELGDLTPEHFDLWRAWMEAEGNPTDTGLAPWCKPDDWELTSEATLMLFDVWEHIDQLPVVPRRSETTKARYIGGVQGV